MLHDQWKIIAVLAGSLMLAIGCDTSQPTADSTRVPSSQQLASSGTSAAQEIKDAQVTPEIAKDAVNEEGLVVLHESEEPPISPQSTAETEIKSSDPIEQVTAAEDRAAAVPATLAASKSEADAAASPASTATRKKSDTAPTSKLPAEANVTSDEERNQSIGSDWPEPQVVLFVSGQQHGYLEPCGCTGLETQKGGLIRRDTLLSELQERGWEMVPIDVGNQVRRIGPQPELKFQTTVEALKLMGYRAATLGVDDLKLSSIELIGAASSDELNPGAFISANVSIIDPSFFPGYRIVEAGGRKIGITAALGSEFKARVQSDDVEVFEPVEKLQPVVAELREQECDFVVLLAHASIDESAEMAREVGGFDLVVTAGGYGEPTLKPEPIAGTDAVMVQVGTKGMYGGIVGLFDDEETPLRYQKIAITSQFKDSKRMLDEFAKYQEKLKLAGYDGLGINPISHPTGRQFVGSESCGDCHTTAYEIWEDSPHVHATDSIVAPPNDRGGIARHFDPECISCHVTGWNPQNFYPYESGFINLESSELLLASGCENCHGPGKDHVDAENGDVDVDNDTLLKLRQQMIIKLDQARDKCLECHDLDNSPDFHVEGAFEEYWEQVKHYGLD